MPSDLDIARAAALRPIGEVAQAAGFTPDTLSPYGKYIAKVNQRPYMARPAKARPMRTMAMAGAAAIATMHDSAAHSRMAAVTRQRPARRE